MAMLINFDFLTAKSEVLTIPRINDEFLNIEYQLIQKEQESQSYFKIYKNSTKIALIQ